jgi:hypothetical protein
MVKVRNSVELLRREKRRQLIRDPDVIETGVAPDDS